MNGMVTAILFWLLERQNTLYDMPSLQTLFNIMLIGISTKSAGYLPVAMIMVQPATILLLAIAGFVGSAPSSTGGGIKTITR